MTQRQFETTIDWTDFWEDANEDRRTKTAPAAQFTLDPLRSFVETKGAPGSVADVGCGPGTVPFVMAEQFPAATVVGYDAAEPVLAENRDRAEREGHANLAFEQTVLPSFDPDRSFDLVTCFYTLMYVEEIEAALAALYDAVAPGGHLVVTYHNRYAHRHFRTMAEDPHEHLGPESPWDPNNFEDRFELLIEGENLLSHERIHEILGTWPQSIWSVAGEDERYEAWRYNPMVYVPKTV
ncbi:MAG: methylase involved in ubiquinone/menaquinone biosynthesis [halophilic archaeon J07HX64]|jgi:Methylase involved in ubiquinone/menaquinone biosynthesis|nr:MAG: methylase involved in ubiquinone/menaquinone biosynthesis [halophilic archaeon J07HX64]